MGIKILDDHGKFAGNNMIALVQYFCRKGMQ